MKYEEYPHKVAAIYPDAAAAADAIRTLGHLKPGATRIMRLTPGAAEIDASIEPEAEKTKHTLIKKTLTGTIVGTATGALVASAAATLAPTVFVSAPVVGPMIILGYGAAIGGTTGAVHGLKLREGMLSGLVKDALKAGYHVVIVHAANDEVLHEAERAISDTMAEITTYT